MRFKTDISAADQFNLRVRARSAHFRQLLRSLSDHVYPPLQLAPQFEDVHLVRDAIRVADAFHIAELNQFFQTPHYGYARQLQCVRDLACLNGRAHDRAQEDVDADGSVGQAVTVGSKLGAVVVGDGSHQAQVEATDEKPLTRWFDAGRRSALCNQDEIQTAPAF